MQINAENFSIALHLRFQLDLSMAQQTPRYRTAVAIIIIQMTIKSIKSDALFIHVFLCQPWMYFFSFYYLILRIIIITIY